MFNRKSLLVLVIALIITFSLLVTSIAAITENFPISEKLSVSQPDYSDAGWSVYIANMTQGDTYIGNIYLRIEPSYQRSNGNTTSTYHGLVSVAHYAWTELDSITLKIGSGNVQIKEIDSEGHIATLSTTDNQQILAIKDFGQAGRYTIRFEFSMQVDNAVEIPAEFHLSLHKINQPIVLTSLKADTTIEVKLPSITA